MGSERPVPCAVPPGLQEMLEEFSKEVLRQKPDNIYCFLADYCEAKLRGMLPRCGEMAAANAGRFPATSEAPPTVIPPPTLKKLEDQGQLLEKLRAQVCAAGHFEGGQEGQGPPCIKDKINCVLTQALELVTTLQNLQNSAPACQDQGSNPDGPWSQANPWVRGQGQPASPQDICNHIHCLVRYVDQLSQQFDLALGNSNCPYHGGHWMPECGGPFFQDPWNVAAGQNVSNGFQNGAPIPQGMIYVPPEPREGCYDLCFEQNAAAIEAQDFGAAARFADPTGGLVQESVNDQVPGNPTGNAPPKVDSASFKMPGLTQIAAAAGATAITQLSAGASAQSLIPSITQSVADLFGAEGENGIHTTLKAINSNISTVWAVSDASAAGEWSGVIQDFLGNQLSVIQKLLTGQMPLKDAPYEVAFLTVAFVMGVVVGYRQLSGDGAGCESVLNRSDWGRNANVVFADRFTPGISRCL